LAEGARMNELEFVAALLPNPNPVLTAILETNEFRSNSMVWYVWPIPKDTLMSSAGSKEMVNHSRVHLLN
jgi:hypothetical protein